jgi:DNA-binding HxlR family transcriptional regulator
MTWSPGRNPFLPAHDGAKPMKPGNPYNAKCPTRLILDRVGDKWAVLLLGLLRKEPMRFNALRRHIDGISQKMLSQTLKSLERDGLVRRHAIATVPVTVEYSITPLGVTLAKAVDPLRHWAETHLKEVQAAQRRYDGSQRDAA